MSDLVIAADQIFDGTRVLGPGVVCARDGLVLDLDTGPMAVLASGLAPVPFLMPGLVDAHVHSSGYREGNPAGNPYGPVKHFMRLCTSCGVTTIRDVGNSLEALYYFRDWNAQYGGPRLYGSGPLLDGTPFTWPFARRITDVESAGFHARQLIDAKVDLLKAYARLEPDLLRAVVEIASDAGLPVAVHCGRTTATEAARAGVRSLEHAEELLSTLTRDNPDEAEGAIGRARRWARVDPADDSVSRLAETMQRSGTALCPTLLVSRRWCFVDEMTSEPANELMVPVMPYHAHFQHARGSIAVRFASRYMAKYMPVRTLSRGERAEVSAGLDTMSAVVRALADSGVKVVAGTDTPNPSVVPGHSLRAELHLLARAGLSVETVLRAATSVAGDVIGEKRVGRIEPGAFADLLALGGDPMSDLRNLSQVSKVWKGGVEIDLRTVDAKIAEQVQAAE